MNKVFEDLTGYSHHSRSDKNKRDSAVAAALVIINTAVSNNAGYIDEAVKGSLISSLADKIQDALVIPE